MPRKSGSYTDLVNVCSETGRRLWQLEIETETFGSYEFDGSPVIPRARWKDLTAKFPTCNEFSLKKLAERTPYGDWRSMMRAITSCGSQMHFFQDGPLWATATNSFDAGIARVIEIRAAREAANYFTATDCGGGSAANLKQKK